MVLTDSCLAESMNEQVFTTITSASSARAVICAPPVCSMPIMTSLSTRFLGQPRLTKPIFKGLGREAESGCGGATVRFSTGMRSIYCSIEKSRVFAALAWVGDSPASTILVIGGTQHDKSRQSKTKVAKAGFGGHWAAAHHDDRVGQEWKSA